MNVPVRQYWQLLHLYLRPQWRGLLLLAVLLFGGIGLQLINPQIIRFFLDTAERGGAQQSLLNAALLFILFSVIQQVVSVGAAYAGENLGWLATNNLRADLTLHCLRLDMPFHKTHTPGDLIERIDGDVTTLANFFSQFVVRVLGNGLLLVGVLLLLFREDWRVGLALTLYACVTLLVLNALQNIAVEHWANYREASAEHYSFLEERLGGTEDIRASGAAPYVLYRLYGLMRVLLRTYLRARLLGTTTFIITGFLSAVGYAVGLGLGAYLFTRGEATIGTAYLIVYYVGLLNQPLDQIRQQAEDLQQAGASITRVDALFSTQSQLVEAEAPRATLAPGPLSVAFEDVSFHYEAGQDDPVLQDISFHLEPGRVLGLLGRTGSGKTTLTRLLFRLYDPATGTIRLDGTDLRDLSFAELRRRVGMVTQDVQLFGATVRDNLTFFQEGFADDELLRLLHELGLSAWLQGLPNGLDSHLDPGGQGLSAGEAQLLAFARLFLKDPGLVLLDEASSRLDPTTETLLERAVERLLSEPRRTAIIIAHRLSTVQRADDIMILEQGRVIEYGPRVVLAANPNSRFYHLLQTGLEEALA